MILEIKHVSTTTCTCGARPPQCVEYVAHVDGDIALELLADGAAAAAARGGGRGGWLRLAIDVMEVMEACGGVLERNGTIGAPSPLRRDGHVRATTIDVCWRRGSAGGCWRWRRPTRGSLRTTPLVPRRERRGAGELGRAAADKNWCVPQIQVKVVSGEFIDRTGVVVELQVPPRWPRRLAAS